MTEKEAKTKWCPMARIGKEGLNIYSDGDIPEFANCIASECMWWVWDSQDPNNNWQGHCGAIK